MYLLIKGRHGDYSRPFTILSLLGIRLRFFSTRTTLRLESECFHYGVIFEKIKNMNEGKIDPFRSCNYKKIKILSLRDILLVELNSAETEARRTLQDLSEKDFTWEPLSEKEKIIDVVLPPEHKRVWRVFKKDSKWTYDYAMEEFNPAPFTTIHLIMNHVAQTGIMYLQCIKTCKPEGKDLNWDNLPVYPELNQLRDYIYEMLAKNRKYLSSINDKKVINSMNSLTPAPWGEMRPTWLNLWGGVIQHTLQHMMQISVRKENICLEQIKD